jgi:hypothetical protein
VTRRRIVVLVAALLGLVLVVAGATWWIRDHDKSYCDLVADQTAQVQNGQGATESLLATLPTLRRLSDAAPSDLKDEWQVVVNAVDGFREVLAAAGVDPATTDVTSLPDSVTAAQRAEIKAAASRLLSPEVQAAVAGIQQQALDVCHTPLEL